MHDVEATSYLTAWDSYWECNKTKRASPRQRHYAAASHHAGVLLLRRMRTVCNQGHPSAPAEKQSKPANLSSPKRSQTDKHIRKRFVLATIAAMSTKTLTTRRKLTRRRSLTAKPLTLPKVWHLGGMSCHEQPTIARRQCEFSTTPGSQEAAHIN